MRRGLVHAAMAAILMAAVQPARSQSPPIVVQIVTEAGSLPVYKAGSVMTVRVKTSADANLYCFRQKGDGGIERIFPNRGHADAAVAAGNVTEIPGAGAGFRLSLDKEWTWESVRCFATLAASRVDLPAALAPEASRLAVGSLDELDQTFKTVAPGYVAGTLVVAVTN